MGWKRLLAYISDSVDEELLLRNEYLMAENTILRRQIEGRPRLTDDDRKLLAEIGKKLGRRRWPMSQKSLSLTLYWAGITNS